MSEPVTYYEYICAQVDAGLWEQTQAIFGCNAQTLDLHYRMYRLVLNYEPDKRYGYARRICDNEHIYSQLGGGIRMD